MKYIIGLESYYMWTYTVIHIYQSAGEIHVIKHESRPISRVSVSCHSNKLCVSVCLLSLLLLHDLLTLLLFLCWVVQLLAVFMRMDTRLLLTTYIFQPHTQPHWLTFHALLVTLTHSLCVHSICGCMCLTLCVRVSVFCVCKCVTDNPTNKSV